MSNGFREGAIRRSVAFFCIGALGAATHILASSGAEAAAGPPEALTVFSKAKSRCGARWCVRQASSRSEATPGNYVE